MDSLAADRASVIEASQLTLLPAFDDSRNHLIQQAQGMSQVQPDGAHSIAELLDLIRQRSAQTSSGGWIRTSTTWNESNLAEKRLPTAAEIDQATTDHPVWIRRGGTYRLG